jgi:hypothetical protein
MSDAIASAVARTSFLGMGRRADGDAIRILSDCLRSPVDGSWLPGMTICCTILPLMRPCTALEPRPNLVQDLGALLEVEGGGRSFASPRSVGHVCRNRTRELLVSRLFSLRGEESVWDSSGSTFSSLDVSSASENERLSSSSAARRTSCACICSLCVDTERPGEDKPSFEAAPCFQLSAQPKLNPR